MTTADQYIKTHAPRASKALLALRSAYVWVLETTSSDASRRWCFSQYNLDTSLGVRLNDGPRSLRDLMCLWRTVRVHISQHAVLSDHGYRLHNTHTGAIIMLQ